MDNHRLYRPMPPEYFPSDSIIATLDRVNNIVFYRKDIFDTLPYHQQREVYFLKESFLELTTTEPVKHEPLEAFWF